MKLLRLNLIAFGPFNHKLLNFSEGNHGLHIIYGPNEAGKSSALRALRYALYGIPERSSDDFIHPRDKLRIGVSLCNNNGQSSEFIRRKGRLSTLRGADDTTVVSESALQAFLSGADENLFATMFGIDHAALLRGGEEIIRGGGNLGQILFAAGSGISDFRKVQLSIQDDAEKLFKPSGKNPIINEALSKIKDNQKQIKETQLSAADWALHDEALRNAQIRKAAIEAEISEKIRQRGRLERIRNGLSAISRRKEMLSELEPYRNAILLAENFGERRRKAITELKIAENEALSAEKNLEHIKSSKLTGVQNFETLLDHSEMIELFHKKLGEYLKDMLDRPRLQGFFSSNKDEAKRMLAEIRSDLSMDDAFKLQLKKSDVLRVQELGALYEKLIGQRESIVNEKDRISSKIEQSNYRLSEIQEQRTSVSDLPMPENIEHFEEKFKKTEDSLSKRRTELENIVQTISDIQRQTERLQIERAVPTENDLQNVRQKRNELWQTLRNNDFPKDKLESYEQQVFVSDEISDRLRREADRVAQKASLLADAESYKNKHSRLTAQVEASESELSDLTEKWHEFWQQFGITPKSPREMRAWLQKQTALIEKDRQRREQLLSELETRRNELREAQTRADRIESELGIWQTKWALAMIPLGLEKDATPVQAFGVLDDYKNLFYKLREAEGFRKRIDGIDRDTREFSEKVMQFAEKESPELLKLPIEQIVTQLKSRLTTAIKANASMQSLEKQSQSEEKTLKHARQRIIQIQAELNALCEEAGVDTPEKLAEAESRSAKRREIEQKLNHLEETLLELSAGAGLEEFIREALSIDADSIEPQIARLSQEIKESDKQKSELDQTIGRERNELGKMDGSDKAIRLTEDIQGLLAKMSSDAEQYARLKLAAMILSQAIERYREKHQGPMLKRSGELFSKMTLGAFEGLQLEFNDKGQAVLVGVRALGKDIVKVEEMSTGTADQLYLAVRLASLEAFSEKQESPPFIVDDILIQFDDRRALATLQVLAELSRKIQVIFFTHHRHLSELAEKNISSDELFIHRLS